ncbi:hypothetical protein PE067_15595 [Paracoccus sp. DMF-8]|uniref:hypothetical protein n=1 Tax=Paracoccus sp. DMF-8 TaxID=3019445 RepID=UPI0023E3860C|nr:hypothetical protein [Paracoccus sp. DMF-8]MDF3607437.1 hypothetical protein [Paracoccus sp. DMF-8]
MVAIRVSTAQKVSRLKTASGASASPTAIAAMPSKASRVASPLLCVRQLSRAGTRVSAVRISAVRRVPRIASDMSVSEHSSMRIWPNSAGRRGCNRANSSGREVATHVTPPTRRQGTMP